MRLPQTLFSMIFFYQGLIISVFLINLPQTHFCVFYKTSNRGLGLGKSTKTGFGAICPKPCFDVFPAFTPTHPETKTGFGAICPKPCFRRFPKPQTPVCCFIKNTKAGLRSLDFSPMTSTDLEMKLLKTLPFAAEKMSVAQSTGQSSYEVLKASGGAHVAAAGIRRGAKERYVLVSHEAKA